MPKNIDAKKIASIVAIFLFFWGKNQVLFGIDVQIKIIISHH